MCAVVDTECTTPDCKYTSRETEVGGREHSAYGSDMSLPKTMMQQQQRERRRSCEFVQMTNLLCVKSLFEYKNSSPANPKINKDSLQSYLKTLF